MCDTVQRVTCAEVSDLRILSVDVCHLWSVRTRSGNTGKKHELFWQVMMVPFRVKLCKQGQFYCQIAPHFVLMLAVRHCHHVQYLADKWHRLVLSVATTPQNDFCTCSNWLLHVLNLG